MSRRSGHVPAYRLHKPSGQARVIISGEHIYLGSYGSAESREKYARLIAESAAASSGNGADRPPATTTSFPHLSVNELILAYWKFAKTYYAKGGKPTKELACMREALRPLRQLYGHANAGEFGPKALKAVRQHMVDLGLSRGVINRRIGRVQAGLQMGRG